MNFKATNEHLSPKQLNDLIKHLEKTIPNFPKLDGRTYSYDYDSENSDLYLIWEGGYHVSEDHGNYVLDFNSEGRVIGIELLDFKPLEA